MRSTTWRQGLLYLVLAAGLVGLGTATAADDPGFTPLFNGKDLTGLKTFLGDKNADPSKTFLVKDGVLIVTGKPAGYFYTDKSYKDYVLRFDWRYARPEGLKDDVSFKGNSGLLVHIQPPHMTWPKSVEVQGANASHGNTFGIGPKDNRATFKGSYDKAAQKKALKPVGEWNTTEVTTQGGNITVKLNGTQVDSGSGQLTEGPIGFQSEGSEIHFRNIRIKQN
jgi:hypothetical protein